VYSKEAGETRVGRARDATIDARVLAAARRHLSLYGYGGMSLAAVAQEAGTTRQALYRRWPTKADLAAAVVATIEDSATVNRQRHSQRQHHDQ